MLPQNPALQPGQHACHFYEDFNEQKRVALAFIREGLENGEYCAYVTGDQSVDDWYLELQAYGVDVARERQRGALDVLTYAEYRNPGNFNSIRQARQILNLLQEKCVDFDGVRLAGNGGWEIEPALPPDQLTHWEATADVVCEGEDILVICQYDLGRDSPQTIHAALRTHQFAILDGVSRQNPYYEAPEILEREPDLNRLYADTTTVQGMLRKLRSVPVAR
jgi:chemotaxis family two-component system sensor kinase Cph1